MNGKYTYIVLRLRLKHMSQIYNDNTKNSKPKQNQLGILVISTRNIHVLLEIQQRNSAGKFRESAAGVIYLSMRIPPKCCCIFPLKVGATLFSDSRKGTVGA